MADKGNPYELGGRGKTAGQPARPVQAKTYTEEEQREKLIGYVDIPKQFWPYVKYGTHVRYIEKTGKFRAGGFIVNNPFDKKPQGSTTEKRFVKMQNSFYKTAKDHKEWLVAYEDIEFLYAKGTGVELTLRSDLAGAVDTLNTNLARLAEYAKKLERRVADLERR